MKVRKVDRRKQGRSNIEWVLDYYEGPKRIRKWYESKAQAEAAADEIKQQHKHAGQSWLELTPEDRNDLMLLVADARKENVTLRQVWQAYKSGKLDAAPIIRRTLKQAVTETVAAKTAENLRERYVDELENYLDLFIAGRSELYIDRLTVADIEKWFDERGEALATRRSNLGRLSSMFDVCWRRGYIKENPCLKVTPPKLEKKPAVILTPAEAQKLLSVCRRSHPAMLPWLSLAMFAGVRPEEIEKLTWGDVKVREGHVEISAAASKRRNRRTTPLASPLNPLALAWIKLCKPGAPESPIAPSKSTIRRRRAAMRKSANIKWVKDLLRHTAGSYLLELHKNAALVAHWLGHSPRTLENDYKNIVTPDDCKKFWALTPKGVK